MVKVVFENHCPSQPGDGSFGCSYICWFGCMHQYSASEIISKVAVVSGTSDGSYSELSHVKRQPQLKP